MNITNFWICVLFLKLCECRRIDPGLWEIKLQQDLDDLNKDYFDQASYENITKLRIVRDFDSDFVPNRIENIKFDFLKKFPNLKGLLVWAWNFPEFEKIKFAKKLTDLNLSNCKIKFLEPDQLYELEDLEDLHLHENEIEFLPDEYLSHNKKLTRVYMAKNKIKRIPQAFFKQLTDLKIVNFELNELKSLPKLLFQDNKKIEDVSFHSNQIIKLSSALLAGLNQHIIRNFYQNPCATGAWNTRSNLDKCYSNWEESTKLMENGEYLWISL